MNGGRIDTIFYPISSNKHDSVIIHEYKKEDKNTDIKEVTNNALWQIILAKYSNNAILQRDT